MVAVLLTRDKSIVDEDIVAAHQPVVAYSMAAAVVVDLEASIRPRSSKMLQSSFVVVRVLVLRTLNAADS